LILTNHNRFDLRLIHIFNKKQTLTVFKLLWSFPYMSIILLSISGVIGSFFIIGLLKVRFPPFKNIEISLSSHGFECKLRSWYHLML
jgi:hypothetical protein